MSGGITQSITSLLLALGIELPPWGMPAAALVLMVLLLPWILKNMKTSRARKLLKRATMESGAARDAMEQEALSLVSDNPTGLLAFADECVRRGRYGLARAALGRLPEGDTKLERERRRLLTQMAPLEPATAEAAAAAIERFLSEGLVEEAERRLQRAQRRWPEDASLVGLSKRG
ncbi:MAG: hypothetical protein ACI8S6_005752 [Myxococcota bacterium]|jgi:hypothetical protein